MRRFSHSCRVLEHTRGQVYEATDWLAETVAQLGKQIESEIVLPAEPARDFGRAASHFLGQLFAVEAEFSHSGFDLCGNRAAPEFFCIHGANIRIFFINAKYFQGKNLYFTYMLNGEHYELGEQNP